MKDLNKDQKHLLDLMREGMYLVGGYENGMYFACYHIHPTDQETIVNKSMAYDADVDELYYVEHHLNSEEFINWLDHDIETRKYFYCLPYEKVKDCINFPSRFSSLKVMY